MRFRLKSFLMNISLIALQSLQLNQYDFCLHGTVPKTVMRFNTSVSSGRKHADIATKPRWIKPRCIIRTVEVQCNATWVLFVKVPLDMALTIPGSVQQFNGSNENLRLPVKNSDRDRDCDEWYWIGIARTMSSHLFSTFTHSNSG